MFPFFRINLPSLVSHSQVPRCTYAMNCTSSDLRNSQLTNCSFCSLLFNLVTFTNHLIIPHKDFAKHRKFFTNILYNVTLLRLNLHYTKE